MPTRQTESASQIVKESDTASPFLLLLLVKHAILFSPYTIAHAHYVGKKMMYQISLLSRSFNLFLLTSFALTFCLVVFQTWSEHNWLLTMETEHNTWNCKTTLEKGGRKEKYSLMLFKKLVDLKEQVYRMWLWKFIIYYLIREHTPPFFRDDCLCA